MPKDLLADFVNNLSDHLCGYREASQRNILDRVEYLLELERKTNLSKAARLFGERMGELQELIEEIEQGS